MIIKDQTTDSRAKNLLRMVNDMAIMASDSSIDPYDTGEYKEILKKKNKVIKRYSKYRMTTLNYGGEHLQEFCIPFDYIPDEIMDFMHLIQWVDYETMTPHNSDGFFSSSFHGFIDQHKRDTVIEWYIDFDKYLELLLIYNLLKERFKSKVA